MGLCSFLSWSDGVLKQSSVSDRKLLLCCQWLLPVSISLLSHHFTSFLNHLSFSSSKKIVKETIRQRCFTVLMFLFGIRRFIAPTRRLLLTFVTCYKFFLVCFSLFYIKFLGILCKVLHLASVKLSMVK